MKCLKFKSKIDLNKSPKFFPIVYPEITLKNHQIWAILKIIKMAHSLRHFTPSLGYDIIQSMATSSSSVNSTDL